MKKHDSIGGSCLESRHVPALDGLRACAVLMVMAHHLMPLKEYGGNLALDRIVHTGWIGVDLFFVLSGYLITGILADSKGRSNYFRAFYIRRFLRIFPIYYGVIAVMLFIAPLLLRVAPLPANALAAATQSLSQVGSHQIWLWIYLQNFVDVDWAMFNHFWSLAVEEHFYLVWPVAIYLLSRKNAVTLCISVVGVALSCRLLFVQYQEALPGSAYINTFCRMDSLAIGGLLSLLMREKGATAIRPLARFVFTICSLAIVAWASWHGGISHHELVVNVVGYPVLALFWASVLYFVVTMRPGCLIESLLTLRWLCWIGRISYGLYIYHRMLMLPVAIVLPLGRVATAFPTLGVVGWSLAVFAVTILVAWLSWACFEIRFLRFKEKFKPGPFVDRDAKLRGGVGVVSG